MTEPTLTPPREGSLEAPMRHPVDWRSPAFYDEGALFAELERVFDICHGCRRCFNLCHAFPTLFDAIDESETMELDGVDKSVYWQVVDHCYLCDMCFMTKCPYVPPHEWNIDFPNLMLRAKAIKFRKGDVRLRDRILTGTDTLGRMNTLPVVVNVVNAANRAKPARKLMQKTLAVHPEARLPEYRRPTTRAKLSARRPKSVEPQAAGPTCGRVAVFSTCYGNFNHPAIVEDLVAVFEHNDIPVRLLDRERCCGMPKLELGDLETVQRAKEENVAELKALIDDGWDIVAPIPSCVLMFKQELPLLFPEDADVAAVRNRMFDPFEYLALRHKHGKLNTSFAQSLGTVAYHVACHQRVQKIGPRTQELLSLVPETRVEVIERCAGQDGTYGFKDECHSIAMKIARPIVNRVKQAQVDHLTSDCAMAGEHIAYGVGNGAASKHPLTLLRIAYGI